MREHSRQLLSQRFLDRCHPARHASCIVIAVVAVATFKVAAAQATQPVSKGRRLQRVENVTLRRPSMKVIVRGRMAHADPDMLEES